MAALGALRVPVSPRLDGIGEAALARIREQARVQDQARRENSRIHELVTPVEPDKGLAGLPEPSDRDVFFDLEGDAFASDGGLEYLFGVASRARRRPPPPAARSRRTAAPNALDVGYPRVRRSPPHVEQTTSPTSTPCQPQAAQKTRRCTRRGYAQHSDTAPLSVQRAALIGVGVAPRFARGGGPALRPRRRPPPGASAAGAPPRQFAGRFGG